MPFFQNMKRGATPQFIFIPSIYVNGIKHFLMTEKITGWEILKKQDAIPHLPASFQIPEIRLTPTAPRVEKRISCIVSYYDPTDFTHRYNELVASQEWIDYHNEKANAAMAEQEYLNAMASDPSPLSPLRQKQR